MKLSDLWLWLLWILIFLGSGVFVCFLLPKLWVHCTRKKKAFKRRALKPRRLRDGCKENNSPNSIEDNEENEILMKSVPKFGEFIFVPARLPRQGSRKIRLVEQRNGDLILQEEVLSLTTGKPIIVNIIYATPANILENMNGNMQYAVQLCRTLENSVKAVLLEMGLRRIKVDYLRVPSFERNRIAERRPICQRHPLNREKTELSVNQRKAQETVAIECLLRSSSISHNSKHNLQVPKLIKTLCPRHSPLLYDNEESSEDMDNIITKGTAFSPNHRKEPAKTPLDAQRLLEYALRPNPQRAASIRANAIPLHNSEKLLETKAKNVILQLKPNGNSVIVIGCKGTVEKINIDDSKINCTGLTNLTKSQYLQKEMEPLSIDCTYWKSDKPSFSSNETSCVVSLGSLSENSQQGELLMPLEPTVIYGKLGWNYETKNNEFAKVDNSVQQGLETPILDTEGSPSEITQMQSPSGSEKNTMKMNNSIESEPTLTSRSSTINMDIQVDDTVNSGYLHLSNSTSDENCEDPSQNPFERNSPDFV